MLRGVLLSRGLLVMLLLLSCSVTGFAQHNFPMHESPHMFKSVLWANHGLAVEQEIPETLEAIYEFRSMGRVNPIQLDRAYRELNSVHDRILRGRLKYDEDEVHYYKAYVFALAGNYGMALEHASKAYDLNPGKARYAYMLSLAWAYATGDGKQLDVAFRFLTDQREIFRELLMQAAIEASSEGVFVPKAYYYMGLYFYERGDLANAQRFWNELLRSSQEYESYANDLITFSSDSYARFIHAVVPLLNQIDYLLASTRHR